MTKLSKCTLCHVPQTPFLPNRSYKAFARTVIPEQECHLLKQWQELLLASLSLDICLFKHIKSIPLNTGKRTKNLPVVREQHPETYEQDLPFLKGKLHMQNLAKRASCMWKSNMTLTEPLPQVRNPLSSAVQSPPLTHTSSRWFPDRERSPVMDTVRCCWDTSG